ncbi:MAG: transposase [Bythopirellula sp.]|nr:transposase [Bythopirellula sp.]
MSDYRRYFVPGGMYFFTVVAYDRRPILTTPAGRKFLRSAVGKITQDRVFQIFATVLLPDHWHLVMQLPPNDADYSFRLKRIKEEFTRLWLEAGLHEAPVTVSQQSKGERGIWQPRFWEHTIQDETDLERCVDYIHWNPRKHQLVERVRDYPWSSFHRFVRAGQYDIDWGGSEPKSMVRYEAWGEP